MSQMPKIVTVMIDFSNKAIRRLTSSSSCGILGHRAVTSMVHNILLLCLVSEGLKGNVLEFNKEYFIQTSGTDIWIKLALHYAYLFLFKFSIYLLDQYPIKPSTWLRYIYNIFTIWKESEDEPNDFLAYSNTVNPAIQLTHAYSFESVIFWIS